MAKMALSLMLLALTSSCIRASRNTMDFQILSAESTTEGGNLVAGPRSGSGSGSGSSEGIEKVAGIFRSMRYKIGMTNYIDEAGNVHSDKDYIWLQGIQTQTLNDPLVKDMWLQFEVQTVRQGDWNIVATLKHLNRTSSSEVRTDIASFTADLLEAFDWEPVDDYADFKFVLRLGRPVETNFDIMKGTSALYSVLLPDADFYLHGQKITPRNPLWTLSLKHGESTMNFYPTNR
eukprot:gnl/TRDRNA2_/TRDRNA2_50536_c0_seq1.p1 gnl/TRDRNA2_/TRDRNA2_50536_c0~~gnl/TRDRNA2_/TRDRNA2_50536_c0_seq1.p1  ORF type:complete len:233 (+),score=28.97 gnl/TRDRNA2_/TRDRNA2_50536_c0_seq1:78-776(+)